MFKISLGNSKGPIKGKNGKPAGPVEATKANGGKLPGVWINVGTKKDK